MVGASAVIPTTFAGATASPAPPPTAAISSTSGVFPLGEVIHGTASDSGGPGVAHVILYYENVVTIRSGYVVATCANCGAGQTMSTWTVTLPSNGAPGIYEFVAQAVDVASKFGSSSNAIVQIVTAADPTPSAAGGIFNGITCPTSQKCVAVGSTKGGGALIETSSDGGAHFTSMPVPTMAPGLNGVECISASQCMAVGSTKVLISEDGGGTWELVATPSVEPLNSVACQNALACAAVGGGGENGTDIYTTNGGTTWLNGTNPGPPMDAIGVVCPSTTCIAAGETMYVSTNGGAVWSAKGIGPGTTASGTNGVFAVSCPTTTTCLGLGPDPEGLYQPTDPGALLVSTDGGSTWVNNSASLPASTATLQAMACAGPNTCVAVGPPGTTGGPLVVAATANGGVTWTGTTGPSGIVYDQNVPLLGIACSAASTCTMVAGDANGPAAYTTTNNGQTWVKDSVQQS
jgi:hypothetical protein